MLNWVIFWIQESGKVLLECQSNWNRKDKRESLRDFLGRRHRKCKAPRRQVFRHKKAGISGIYSVREAVVRINSVNVSRDENLNF